jgi:hypothetical protein
LQAPKLGAKIRAVRELLSDALEGARVYDLCDWRHPEGGSWFPLSAVDSLQGRGVWLDVRLVEERSSEQLVAWLELNGVPKIFANTVLGRQAVCDDSEQPVRFCELGRPDCELP